MRQEQALVPVLAAVQVQVPAQERVPEPAEQALEPAQGQVRAVRARAPAQERVPVQAARVQAPVPVQARAVRVPALGLERARALGLAAAREAPALRGQAAVARQPAGRQPEAERRPPPVATT